MNVRLLVKQLGLLTTLSLSLNSVMANSSEAITCPSIDMLKQFHMDYSGTSHYDVATQKAIFFADLKQGSDDDDDDDNEDDFLNKNYTSSQGEWRLTLNGIEVGKNQDPEAITYNTIGQLENVSTEPFIHDKIYMDGINLTVPVCFYTLPGASTSTATAYFVKIDRLTPIKKATLKAHFRSMRKAAA